MRIELLGPVRARRAGNPVSLRGVSARTVLACLALRPGSLVSLDELTDALWGDEAPADPVATLQSIVSRLRRAFGAEVIDTVAPGYRLSGTLASVDRADLEVLLRSEETNLSALADCVAGILRAWDGSALGDVADTSWFTPQRIRLAELRVRARDRCHELLLGAGRLDDALVDLQEDAARAPLRDSTQLLLEALHLAGRNAEALRSADRYRRALAEETGLDPSPALSELEQQVLANTAAVRSLDREPSLTVAPAAWLPPDTPFGGREAELETLLILSSERRSVTVVGTGGVGKSRLVMELLQHRPDDDDPVVVLLASVGPGASVVDARFGAGPGGDERFTSGRGRRTTVVEADDRGARQLRARARRRPHPGGRAATTGRGPAGRDDEPAGGERWQRRRGWVLEPDRRRGRVVVRVGVGVVDQCCSVGAGGGTVPTAQAERRAVGEDRTDADGCGRYRFQIADPAQHPIGDFDRACVGVGLAHEVETSGQWVLHGQANRRRQVVGRDGDGPGEGMPGVATSVVALGINSWPSEDLDRRPAPATVDRGRIRNDGTRSARRSGPRTEHCGFDRPYRCDPFGELVEERRRAVRRLEAASMAHTPTHMAGVVNRRDRPSEHRAQSLGSVPQVEEGREDGSAEVS